MSSFLTYDRQRLFAKSSHVCFLARFCRASGGRIENALNNPDSRLASPDVAARVNSHPWIAISEVRAVCVERYGEDVLQALLTGVLLTILARQELVVSQEDVDAEVAQRLNQWAFKPRRKARCLYLVGTNIKREQAIDRVLSHRYRAAHRRFEKACRPRACYSG